MATNEKLSRRQFVRGGVGLLSVSSLMPTAFVSALFSPENKGSSTAQKNGRVLVILQMAGGNDGLNTVVPYTDGQYYQQRPSLAIPQGQAIALDDRIGLHPSLSSLKPLWDGGQMAIVEGVGYPNPDRSHFRSMEIWQTANPAGVSYEGWLGKYLDVTAGESGSLWRAVDLESSISPSFISTGSYVPTLEKVEAYRLQSDPRYRSDTANRTSAWSALYAQAAGGPGFLPFLSSTGVQAYESSLQLQEIAGSYEPALTYPQSQIAQGLKLAAQLITSELGPGIVYLSIGSFDTHAQQANAQAALLTSLAEAVSAFHQDIAGHGRGDDVVLMTWSEFGRRVNQNGSGGTDHGTAGPMFIIGGPVRGGAYGEPPSLANLDDNGDLKYTTDFRSVYATLLEEWLEAEAKDVLGQPFPTLNVF